MHTPSGPTYVTLDGFAGPGGWDEGARILGLDTQIIGIEFDKHAVATATAAGHRRVLQDIRAARPADYAHARGAILSSPCPTFSPSGLGTGRQEMQILLDAVTHAGSGCGCSWEEIAAELEECTDQRTALAAETMRWVLQLPNLEWLALEQAGVPTVEYLFEDIAAELMSVDDDGGGHGPGWESADVFRLDALQLGMPVRRPRNFLVARRYTVLGGHDCPLPYCLPDGTLPPAPTMAQVLGWEPGHRMRTRGNRRGGGGNAFSCDGPSWCLTGSSRSWEREADGARMTAAQAGLLQGFRPDYPWAGARTRQFLQAADVVLPPVAAAVLGYVTGTPWVEPVRAYLDELYAAARSRPGPALMEPVEPAGQLSLLDLIA